MKILFLDIDGVLVTLRYSHAALNNTGLFTDFDPVNISIVNNICNLTGAKIVVISTWRKTAIPTKGMDLIPYLIKEGINIEYFHKDAIAPFRFSSHKLHDINSWLDNHPEYKWENCIVIDDDDIFADLNKKSRHIRTTWEDGISYKNYLQAIELLGIIK